MNIENKKVDIHKAAGVLLKDRKFLITRSEGKNFFIAPGGKVEPEEEVRNALKRELLEELSIEIETDTLTDFGTFYALAAGHENSYLQMDVFIVPVWKGEITPDAEVTEVLWINSVLPKNIELGSIFHHDVLPRLKEKNLID